MELPKDYKFKTAPMEHQLEGFEAMRGREQYGLLMEQGTGKSKLLIDRVSYLFQHGSVNGWVIICPKSICRNWTEKEIPIHMPDGIQRKVAIYQSGMGVKQEQQVISLFKIEPLTLHILCTNTDTLATDRGKKVLQTFLKGHKAVLSIDESSSIKNHKAKRSKVALKLAPLASYRYILNGTPVPNGPMDVFSQFEFLKPGLLGHSSWFSFRARYGIIKKVFVSTHSFDKIVGYQRLPELEATIKQHSFRKLKSECLDLPPKIYMPPRLVDLSDAQRQLYTQLKEEAFAELSAMDSVSAPLVLTRFLRMRQVLCNWVKTDEGEEVRVGDKNPRLEDLLEVMAQASGKALVWCTFTRPLLELTQQLQKEVGPTASFYGGTDAILRHSLVERFQDPKDELRFLVMQPSTGGKGLTLTQAQDLAYYNNDWSLEVREQSEDRPHRKGLEHPVTYTDFVAPGTLDEHLLELLKSKKDLAQAVTGDWKRLLA